MHHALQLASLYTYMHSGIRIDIQMTACSSDRRTMNRLSIKYQVGLDHRVSGVSLSERRVSFDIQPMRYDTIRIECRVSLQNA